MKGFINTLFSSNLRTAETSQRARHTALGIALVVGVLFFTTPATAQDTTFAKLKLRECPEGWVPSIAPGGCSPGFLTLETAGLESIEGCPDGWVESAAPGGCSPEFFTLGLNGVRDSRQSCPDGWVRSSAPGGCSPGFITLGQAGLRAIDECPDGWVRSSAPGGCSPDNFTLQTGFDGVDRASFNCAFGDACEPMIESIKALGGSCETSGQDTTCDLPPLIDHDE